MKHPFHHDRPACRQPRHERAVLRRGFTLLELLVVISIIAVLAAMMLSAVKLVRGAAQTRQCAAVMGQIGLFMHEYSEENDGLLPGGGQNPWSVSWCDILNQELLNQQNVTLGRWSGNSGQLGGTSRFVCPTFRAPGASYRPYAMNIIANGGSAPTYATATMVTPPTSRGPLYTLYYFGAALARFNRPTTKVLLQEVNYGNDFTFASGPTGQWSNVTTFDTYTNTNGGTFSFRHSGRSGNFLYMDLHVETKMIDPALNNMLYYDMP